MAEKGREKPNILSRVEEEDLARGGRRFVSGVDLLNIRSSDLTKKGQNILEESGQETFTLAEAEGLGLSPKDFRKDLRKPLKQQDIFLGKNRFAAPEVLNQFVQGPSDETQAQLDQATQQGLDLFTGGLTTAQQGLDLAGGRGGDTALGRDVLNVFDERFGSQLAGRGLADSGAAAFGSTIGGLSALSQFGQDLIGAGGSAAGLGQQTAFSTNPFLDPAFNLEREDLRFSRQNFFFQFEQMKNQQRRARNQFSTSNIIKQNFAQQVGSGGPISSVLSFGGGPSQSGPVQNV